MGAIARVVVSETGVAKSNFYRAALVRSGAQFQRETFPEFAGTMCEHRRFEHSDFVSREIFQGSFPLPPPPPPLRRAIS